MRRAIALLALYAIPLYPQTFSAVPNPFARGLQLVSSSGVGVFVGGSFTSQTSVAITHNLGTQNVYVSCQKPSHAGVLGYADAVPTDANTVTVTFSPASSGYCMVFASGSTSGGGVAGSSGQVQFNNGTGFGASSGFAYNDTTKFAGLIGGVTVGQASTATGQVKFNGLTSGVVTVQPQDAAGTWTFKWPTTGGTSGYSLLTDGSGVTSWGLRLADPGSNGVLLRTAAGTTGVVSGTATDCVYVNGTSGSCGGSGSLPALTGQSLKFLGVLTDESAANWRTLDAGGSGAIAFTNVDASATIDIDTAVVPRKATSETIAGLWTMSPGLLFPTMAAPGNPSAGAVRVFANSATGNLECLKSDGSSCLATGGGGLADPGSNGIIKRTALNTTAAAVAGTDYYAPGGAIASTDLPNPGASAGGKVQSKTCTTGDFVSAINTDSTVTCTTAGGTSFTLNAPPSETFTTQTSVTITDNLGTKDKIAACRNASDVGIGWDTITYADNTTTITFSPAASGTCTVTTVVPQTVTAGAPVDSANTFTRGQVIDGTVDEIQLRVQGHSTQTNPIFVAEKSDGTDILVVNNDGSVQMGSGSGPWELTNIAAPGTPAAGKTNIWADSTDKVVKAKNDAGSVIAMVPASVRDVACIQAVFNSPVVGDTLYAPPVPAAGTITGWSITAVGGTSPTATFDVWAIADGGTALPTVSNTITASAKPALATGNILRSTTLTGWTTALAQYDSPAVKLDAVSGSPTQLILSVYCQR